MAKKYEVLRERVRLPTGGYADAFRLAIFEFSCLGEKRFDIMGYPHDSEEDALGGDWDRLADDAKAAATRVKTEIESEKELPTDVGPRRQARS